MEKELTPQVSLDLINYQLAELGFEVVQGDLVYHFRPFPSTPIRLSDNDTVVDVTDHNQLTRDQWRRELLARINDAITTDRHTVHDGNRIVLAHEFTLIHQGRVFYYPAGTRATCAGRSGDGFVKVRFRGGLMTNMRVDFVKLVVQRVRSKKPTKRIRTRRK